jgi:hypothetical protein
MSHRTNASRTTESTDHDADRPDLLSPTPAALRGADAGALADASPGGEPRTATVEGVDERATYRFRVSDAVTPVGADGSVDVVNENTVLGTAEPGDATDFRFAGDLVSFTVLDGDVAVTVDGDEVAVPLHAERDLPNTVTLEAEGDVVDYRFSATGGVEKGPLVDGGADTIDGKRVVGTLGSQGVDNYFFAGSLVFESASGPVTVTLDVDEGASE